MKRNTMILIGLFVVLAAAALLILQKPGEQSASGGSLGSMFQMDSAAVDKIELKTGTQTIALEKRGTEWFVVQPVNYRADQMSVAQLIHQTKMMENKGTVSTKPEKFSVFQVDQSGTEVKFFEKGTERTSFVLGKMAASYVDSYVRKLNTNEVRLAGGVNSYLFSRSAKDWRDKSIVTTPKETIVSVRYQYGDTTFTLSFQDSTWLVGREKVQQPVVDALLSALSSVQADDFIDSLMTPKISATVLYAGVQLRFSFDKPLNRYLVQSSQSSQWFVMDSWRANQILKRKRDLLASSQR